MANPVLTPALLTAGLLFQPALVLPQPGIFASPAMQLLVTGLLTAGILFLTNWLTQRNLKMSIENIRLQAENAAAELKNQADKVDIIAENTAATQVAQAEIGVKVDGQMSALHSVIEGLRSDLVAAKLAVVTEEDKAVELAKQAIKDKAESDAKLVEAKQATAVPAPLVVANGGSTQSVTIPTQTLPVEDAAKDATEKPLILKPGDV